SYPKDKPTIGLILLASFSDNGLRFRDVRRIHASFIREAGNLDSKTTRASFINNTGIH
ncbi:14740_t:CDS:2, partial [Funneliformis geosporum]